MRAAIELLQQQLEIAGEEGLSELPTNLTTLFSTIGTSVETAKGDPTVSPSSQSNKSGTPIPSITMGGGDSRHPTMSEVVPLPQIANVQGNTYQNDQSSWESPNRSILSDSLLSYSQLDLISDTQEPISSFWNKPDPPFPSDRLSASDYRDSAGVKSALLPTILPQHSESIETTTNSIESIQSTHCSMYDDTGGKTLLDSSVHNPLGVMAFAVDHTNAAYTGNIATRGLEFQCQEEAAAQAAALLNSPYTMAVGASANTPARLNSLSWMISANDTDIQSGSGEILYFRGKLDDHNVDRALESDPISIGLCEEKESDALCSMYVCHFLALGYMLLLTCCLRFYDRLNPFLGILDPCIHTKSFMRARSLFLVTSVLASAAQFLNGGEALGKRLSRHAAVSLWRPAISSHFNLHEAEIGLLQSSVFGRPGIQIRSQKSGDHTRLLHLSLVASAVSDHRR